MTTVREQFEGHFFDALDFPKGELVPMVIEAIVDAGAEKDARGKVIDRPIFSFKGQTKRLIVGKTSWKNCKAIFDTPDAAKWIGKTIHLQRRYLKAAQAFGQENCPCIRIVPAVGTPILKGAANWMGSATPHGNVPQPQADVPPLSPEDQEFIATATKELTGATSIEELRGYGEILKGKSKAVQDALRPTYGKRNAELKNKENQSVEDRGIPRSEGDG